MQNTDEKLTARFWIDDFEIDPNDLTLRGPLGEVSLEPKVMQVLVALAENAGQVVTRDVLMDKVWAVEFGSDESLTRAISVLRKNFGDGRGRRAVIETIPRKGYKLVGAVSQQAGTPLAVPDVSLAQDVGVTTTSKSPSRSWKLFSALAVLLVITGFALSQFWRSSSADTQMESVSVTVDRIAITPFETRGDAERTGTFSTTLRSEMSSLLLANGIMTTFQDETNDSNRKLSLTGEIDGQENGLRVTVRLLDHPTQSILWSETFERPYADLDRFETEISAKSAGLVRCILQWRPDAMVSEASILVLYARYCADDSLGQFDWVLKAEQIFEAEPENLSAKSLFAHALNRSAQQDRSLSDSEKKAYLKKSKDLIDQVLIADPEFPLANFVIAKSMPRAHNWAEIENRLVLATLQGQVPDMVQGNYAWLLRDVGRSRAATAVYEKMAAANPTDVFLQTRLGFMYAVVREERAAERQFERAEQLDPDWQLLYQRRIQLAVFLGDPEKALELLSEPPPDTYLHSKRYQDCYAAFARAKMSDAPDIDALEANCDENGASWVVRMFTALGDVDRAFVLAEQTDWFEPGNSPMAYFYPDMAPFRADPRFWPHAQKIGLVSYWQETGRWPDFCESDDLPVDCQTAAAGILEQ